MVFGEMIEPVLSGRDLSRQEAEALMRYLMSGQATDAQIGGALLALRTRVCASQELAGFASAMRAEANSLDHGLERVVDTCGTGGGRPSFNISTAAAIVAAAAGVRLAKHGNRAVTSTCGSADVLESLGARIGGEADELVERLRTVGLVFLFAPAHHPAMRFVAQARRELGVRTVFNQLGPLANPAGARRQLIGVYDPDLMPSMGEALLDLGAERAILAHGRDGLDEISPVVATDVVRVWEGEVVCEVWRPSDFGLDPLDPSAIAPGAGVDENAAILREAISDPSSPRCLATLPSAAVAIWIADLAPDLPAAAELAHEQVRSGAAGAKLEELVASGGRTRSPHP